MSVKINIYGGGLSGLSTAFELSKYDFDITIYEQEEINGGFAKSKYINFVVPDALMEMDEESSTDPDIEMINLEPGDDKWN